MCYVYRLFNVMRELLWVGVTSSLNERFSHHRNEREWAPEIATATVTWFPDRPAALLAETEAIKKEAPKYNKAVGDPEALFNPRFGSCPRCGGPKQNMTVAYCPPCRTKYDQERKRARGWLPRPPPTMICPTCGGPKKQGPGYCNKCKSARNKEYRKNRALKKRGLTKN